MEGRGIRVVVGWSGRIGRIGRMGRMGVRVRNCERRCEVWRGEGRVGSLAVPGWCGGVESLNGAGPAGWLRRAAAGFRIPRPSAGWFGGGDGLIVGSGA
jgi:hypothetical protein